MQFTSIERSSVFIDVGSEKNDNVLKANAVSIEENV